MATTDYRGRLAPLRFYCGLRRTPPLIVNRSTSVVECFALAELVINWRQSLQGISLKGASLDPHQRTTGRPHQRPSELQSMP